jgi:predicted nucleotidyltransferase component of viral defense system
LSKRTPVNVAASVRQRLLDRARARGEVFDLVATRYALEKFLYRISLSRHSKRLILKGAMLFSVWADLPHRTTRDMDLSIADEDADSLEGMMREICAVEVAQDGMVFHADSIRLEEIREGQQYQGMRVLLNATLEKMPLRVQIDVGFGDAVTPDPKLIEYPTLLDDHPKPRIMAYPHESVISEKLESMVSLGMANSRMKDFFDVWVISKTFSIEGGVLVDALGATFRRRGTTVPEGTPLALSAEFAQNTDKVIQWNAFLARGDLDSEQTQLEKVIRELSLFLLEPLAAARSGEAFERQWTPGGPWLEQ